MAEAILVALGLAAAELTGGETSEGRRESASARLDCDPNRLVLARFRLLPDDDEDESDESDRCSVAVDARRFSSLGEVASAPPSAEAGSADA